MGIRRASRFTAAIMVIALGPVVPALTSAYPPAAATAAAAAPPPTAGLAYVALGDSYAAGLGLTPSTGAPVAACDQSSADYPHRVATALGLRLVDETCSGAVSADLISTSQKLGSVVTPPQSSALSTSTRVVTITIGGNDLGFVTAVQHCLALTPHGPILATGKSTCRASYVADGVDSLTAKIKGSVRSNLTRAFAAVRARAPHAKVFVVGYPALFPNASHTPAKGCFSGSVSGGLTDIDLENAFPYTPTDVVYLHSVEAELDSETRAVALAAGFRYSSTLAASEAHTPCAGSQRSFVNPITLTSKNFSFTVGSGALHPNARGAAFLAASVIPEITAAFPASAPTATAGPTTTPVHPGSSPLPWIVSAALIALIAVGVALVMRRRRHKG